MAWRIIGSWADLVGTTYGRLLLLKIALALVVIALPSWNRFVLLPRVCAAAERSGDRRSTGRVVRTVVTEAAVLVALLLVTGFLVHESPAPAAVEPADTGAVAAALTDELRVVGLLTPGGPGPNTLVLPTGGPWELQVSVRQSEFESPVATLRLPD